MNFSEDAGERLLRLAGEPRAAAARLAGEQLERLKPAIVAPFQEGLYAGPVAKVDRGGVLIVLADENRVLAFHMVPADDKRCLPALRDMARFAKNSFPNRWWGASLVVGVVEFALERYGGGPGGKPPSAPQPVTMTIVGTLLAHVGEEAIGVAAAEIDKCRAAGVCPAIAWMVGPGSKEPDARSIAMCTLPLAPYIDLVMDGGIIQCTVRSEVNTAKSDLA